MMRMASAASIIATVLVTAPLAHAESVLVTPPMWREAVPTICLLVNAGKANVTGSIELVNLGGIVEVGPDEFTVGPGKTVSAGRVTAAGSEILYCRFTLTKGSKKSVRAQICVLSSVDLSGPCLSTAEAR